MQRRTAWLGLAAAVAVAGAAGGVVAVTRHGASETFGPPPSSYVVVYRTVANGVTQWEVVAAHRPLSGSDLTYRTSTRPAADARADGGTISTPTGLFTEDAN